MWSLASTSLREGHPRASGTVSDMGVALSVVRVPQAEAQAHATRASALRSCTVNRTSTRTRYTLGSSDLREATASIWLPFPHMVMPEAFQLKQSANRRRRDRCVSVFRGRFVEYRPRDFAACFTAHFNSESVAGSLDFDRWLLVDTAGSATIRETVRSNPRPAMAMAACTFTFRETLRTLGGRPW